MEEEKKYKITLTTKQSKVFAWFYEYYNIWEKIYFDPEVKGVMFHFDQNKKIGKVQLNVFPKKNKETLDKKEDID